MIEAITKAVGETGKEGMKEVGKGIGDKVPDFSKNIKIGFGDKVPDFPKPQTFKAREVNSDINIAKDEQGKIEKKSPYSENVNENISSEEELDIYTDAGLEENQVGDQKALTRDDIDIEQMDEDGQTNLERMEKGKPPLDKDGKPIELHHIGQKPDSPLAELKQNEHRGLGNDSVLHDKTQDSKIDRQEFNKEKSDYWKARAEQIKQGDN